MTDLQKAVSTTALVDKNTVILHVAFPEKGCTKFVRCARNLPIGEIKSYFHALYKFEDDLYALYIPAVDAKGVLSFADGKWCDDAKLAQDYKLQPRDKVILAKRFPTSQPTPVAETKKNRRLSRRILGFFSPSDNKGTLKQSQSLQQIQQPSAVEVSEASGGAFSSAAEEEEFLKFANSLAQMASKQNAASGSSPPDGPSSLPALALPVVPGSGPRVPTVARAHASPQSVRQRRMTFDTRHIESLISMEKETNPAFRRQELVKFLSDFLDTRVSVDELISSGIIAVDPPPALCDSPVNVEFVEKMFEWILNHGMIEGIFRISGPSQDIDAMTDILNKGLLFDLNAQMNPHLVASVLKKYIRDRPFATIPYRCYRSAVLKHDTLPDKYAPFSLEECKAFIESLPEDKPRLFRLVIQYLKKMTAFKEVTKMSDSNLAIVWAPVLMRCRGDGLSSFSESDRQTDFLIRFIELIDDLMECERREPTGISNTVLSSPGDGPAMISADEKTPEKHKHRKHHHHHHHHRHGHSGSSSRKKSGSADSSPVMSPVLGAIPTDFVTMSPRVSRKKEGKRRVSAVDVSSDRKNVDTDSPSSATFSPVCSLDPKSPIQAENSSEFASTPTDSQKSSSQPDITPTDTQLPSAPEESSTTEPRASGQTDAPLPPAVEQSGGAEPSTTEQSGGDAQPSATEQSDATQPSATEQNDATQS